MADKIPRHMAGALLHIEKLKLQITPRSRDILEKGESKTLGFLPCLLNRLTSLKRLDLNLFTAERTKARFEFPITSVDDACYAYSQVFPPLGRWPCLEDLMIQGLAIDGLDFLLLTNHQMPQRKRLWMNRIDLLESR